MSVYIYIHISIYLDEYISICFSIDTFIVIIIYIYKGIYICGYFCLNISILLFFLSIYI